MPAGRSRRREGTPDQQAAAAAARQERLEDLHRQLADGVAALRDGQAWRDWLDIASRFHRYSFNNQLLIAAQKPDATFVAGYGAWNALGRQVRKGEKALWVLAPVTGRGRSSGAVTDVEELAPAETGDVELGPALRMRGAVRGFTAVGVFDISQTDGDPLPTPPRPLLLVGHAPEGLWDALTEVITTRGFTVHRCPDAAAIGGANGVTDFRDRTVTVRADVDDAQAVKTLAHEAGHVLLHNPAGRTAEQPACRDLIEVEAESVAYLVAAHHGLDTSGYTFAYIAGWAGRDEAAVTATAGRVLSAARTLLEATDADTGGSASSMVSGAAQQAGSTAEAAKVTQDRVARVARDRAEHTGTLRAVNDATRRWFLEQAVTSKAYAAAVTARGHAVEDAIEFGVGWAPTTWTGLVDHLRGAGFTNDTLVAAGVVTTARNGRLIDRFRGRITFPIHDELGVVGFTARDTTGSALAPKYLNTPATELYDKSRLLFGTQHIPRETGEAAHPTVLVLTEGPWDALAVTAAGNGDVFGIAACGTAVTDHHLDLLRSRPESSLVLAPDADPAGTAALGRTLAMLAQHGHAHPVAVTSPLGSDLAEVLAAGGKDAVRAALADARPAGIVYAEVYLLANPPADSPEARVAAARAAAAHAGGLTIRQRAGLGALLIGRGGISPDAALVLVSPGPATPSSPTRAAAVPERPVSTACLNGPSAVRTLV